MTTRALEGLDPILAAEKPDWVLAQGDTTTTFVAALAAFYHQAKFGHVEAGLRTGNAYDPFPEEMNRLLTTRLATLHFPPTPEAAANLRADGVADEAIVLTGNTVIDALLVAAAQDYVPDDPALQDDLGRPAPRDSGHRAPARELGRADGAHRRRPSARWWTRTRTRWPSSPCTGTRSSARR